MTRDSIARANNPNKEFRLWVYFRIGWASYFAFIFAMVNTLVITYFLAIDHIPMLQEIFPSFTHYVMVGVIVGIPVLVGVGYIHFKISHSFKAESDIRVETNKHQFRILYNTEVILVVIFRLNSLLIKKMNGEKIKNSELNEINELKKKILEHKKNRTINEETLIEIDKIIG